VPDDAPHRAVAAIALAIIPAGIALRRRAPVACVLLVLGAGTVLQSLHHPYTNHLFLPFFAVFGATYSLGAHTEGRTLAVGTGLATALAIALTVVDEGTDASSYVFSLAVMTLGPVMIGRLMRNRARLNRALRDRTAALERRRAGAAERAVSDERARIAGELDDVVAHALSAMTVQASGARRLVGTEPARAREAFAAVESTGRDALDELRRLLGVLRRSDEDLALAPQPSLRHAGSLARRAAIPVELVADPDSRDLPAGLDLTAYRVLQEALAAAERSHAGRATVRVRYAADAVELEVLDDGPACEERTLVGVGERVALYGGRLTSGPRRGGGHAVRARLPLGAV
jgi:signal transduction histidine kinase